MIKINGKEYKEKKIDFNAICKLEEYGLQLDNIDKAKLSTLRALVALVTDKPIEEAGVELQEELLSGDKKNIEALAKMFADSDFFKAQQSKSKK